MFRATAVTHYLASKVTKAAESYGGKGFDTIHLDWLARSVQAGALLPLRPAHYLVLSAATRLQTPGMSKHGDLCAPLQPPWDSCRLPGLESCACASWVMPNCVHRIRLGMLRFVSCAYTTWVMLNCVHRVRLRMLGVVTCACTTWVMPSCLHRMRLRTPTDW